VNVLLSFDYFSFLLFKTINYTNYFKSKGLASSRFTTKWYGEKNPVASNDTPDGRAKNRRVNVVIVPNEKMKAEAKKQAGQ